jgi:hypothetical protein
MYGYESSTTLTTGRLHYKLQPVLSSERAQQDEEQSNFPAKQTEKVKSGHGPQRGARHQDG